MTYGLEMSYHILSSQIFMARNGFELCMPGSLATPAINKHFATTYITATPICDEKRWNMHDVYFYLIGFLTDSEKVNAIE